MRCLEAACHSSSSFFISLSNHSGMVFTTSTFQFLYFILFLVAIILTVLLSQRRRKASAIPSASDPNTETNEEQAEDETQDAMVRADIDWTAVRQPYDAYLVLDVEATCMPGTDFNYANEIIVCLQPAIDISNLTPCIPYPRRYRRSGPCVCFAGNTRTIRARQAGSRSLMNSAPLSSLCGDPNCHPSVLH